MKVYIVFYMDHDEFPQTAKGFTDIEKALEYMRDKDKNSKFGWYYETVEVIQ